MVVVCASCLAACVQWRPLAPPLAADAPAAERPASALPRWVRVTTRDSVRYLLEYPTFRGDTLVGNTSGDEQGAATPAVVRLPAAEIAHLEARVPSLTGSVGVAAGVLAGVAAVAWAAGHAAP